MNDFMLYFNLFIAVYVLYYAVKGTGKIYENDYPKEIKEDHARFLRKFCWVVGIGMLPLTIMELVLQGNPYIAFFSWANIGFVLVCIVVYLIVFRKRWGKFVYPQKRK